MHSQIVPLTKRLSATSTWDRLAALIMGIGLLIRLPLVWNSSESWRPEDTASIAHFFLINGFNILYPQIYWGGNGPGFVESEFQLYPFLVALLYSIFGEQMWLGRLVSFLFSAATILLFYLLAKKLLRLREALWSLFLFVLSPILLRYGTAFMPEATMLFFYVAGLFLFTKWLDGRRFLYLALAALSTCIAVLVKPTAIHIGLLFALLAVYRFGLVSLAKDWRIWVTVGLCLTPIALYFWHAHILYVEYGNTFGVLFSGDTKFGNFSYWLSTEFYAGLVRIEWWWILSPLGAAIVTVGLLVSIKRRIYIIPFAFATLLTYYLITARYSGYSRGVQYHIYMVPFAALAFGLGTEALFQSKYRRLTSILAWVSLSAVFLWSARLYPSLAYSAHLDQFRNCAASVQRVVPIDSLIVVSSPFNSVDQQNIAENYQEPMVFYYSQRRGWSQPSDWLTPDKFEELRQNSAGYYVILDRDLPLLSSNPRFGSYLDSHLTRLETGTGSNCTIYRFK